MINIKKYENFINESSNDNSGDWFICKQDSITLKCKDFICRDIGNNLYQFLLPYSNKFMNIPSKGNRVFNLSKYNLTKLEIRNNTTITHASDNIESILDISSISNDSVDYIDFGETNDMISYLPKSKINPSNYDNPYNNRYRQSMKIGKFFKKHSIFNSDDLTIQSVELITNIYKSINHSVLSDNMFEIVEGEDIRKWYNCDNYYDDGGTLNNSCMKYPSYGIRFNIYVDNPSVCRMVIMRNVDDPNKIVGRALIWKTNKGIVMDRIYTTDDYYVYNFMGFSFSKGWSLKDNIKKHTIIQLSDKYHFDSIKFTPYLDTFKFYNIDKNQLSNSRPKNTFNFMVFDYM